MYQFCAPLWIYPGQNPWYFVTLPFDHADAIEEIASARARQRGFGSVRVQVTVGDTTWQTSIFPDSKLRSYVLPVKAPVRRAEGLEDGSLVDVTLALLDP